MLQLGHVCSWEARYFLRRAPFLSPPQVGAIVRQGGRPEVPPRSELPGPDTAGWDSLDAYVQLMR